MQPGECVPQERLLVLLRVLEQRLVSTRGMTRIFHCELREAVGR